MIKKIGYFYPTMFSVLDKIVCDSPKNTLPNRGKQIYPKNRFDFKNKPLNWEQLT